MKKISEIILPVFAFVIAFGAVKYGFDMYKQYISDNQVNTIVSKIENKIDNDDTDRTYSEKILDASQEMINQRLKHANPADASNKDKAFAAGVFAGQYSRATQATLDYCKTLGVDVSIFSNRYRAMHEKIYLHANKILKEGGSSVEKTYIDIKDILLPYVKKEMQDIKTIFNNAGYSEFTLVDSCSYFNDMARDEKIMNEFRFSNVMPKPYKILMESM